MSADKIKQFAKEIKKNSWIEDPISDDLEKICDMLTEAVEALEEISNINFGGANIYSAVDDVNFITTETLSKLAGRLE